ncbi:3-methyl-2-oxobutanoate hydroxymethyltransferase [bacterium]|nr:3-methyl-2-oxobutanoate hydroxymethyltransferase [bacterium]
MPARAVNVPWFREAKKKGEAFTVLSLYEAWSARIAEEAGVRILLVGDSLATSIQGHETTLSVTMDDMVYHTKAVTRSAVRSFVIADMPFLSYGVDETDAVRNAGRFLSEAGAHAVKVEGGAEIAGVVSRLVERGIPVLGHIGMTPQHYLRIGGYRVQGRGEPGAKRLVADAKALEKAGVFGIVLELVTEETAARVTKTVGVPTIGIGAGRKVDAQILVFHDLVGLNTSFAPNFLKRYAELGEDATSAVKQFLADVSSGKFPSEENVFHNNP